MTDITIIMGVMGLLFGILGLVRNKVGQLIGIAFLVVFRPLYYTAISYVSPSLLAYVQTDAIVITPQRSLGEYIGSLCLEMKTHEVDSPLSVRYMVSLLQPFCVSAADGAGLAMTASGLFGLILTPLGALK